MPKKAGLEFGKLEEYPYLSVCTIGTHDMTTLRGWWKEDAEQTERFYHNELHYWGKAPERCTGLALRRSYPAPFAMPVHALHSDVARLDFDE